MQIIIKTINMMHFPNKRNYLIFKKNIMIIYLIQVKINNKEYNYLIKM